MAEGRAGCRALHRGPHGRDGLREVPQAHDASGRPCENVKTVLADIFARLLAEIGQGEGACLCVANTNPVEDNQTLKTAIGTALIHGVEGGKAEPLALLAMTAPNLSPTHPGLLSFV